MANMLALLGRAEPNQALAQLEDMRKTHPNSAAVVAQLAGLYAGQGMLDRAIANAKQAVEMAPDNLFYVYNLAILHDRGGRSRDAAVAYREVLQRVGGGESGGLSLPVADIQSRLAYLTQ
jgi:Flp pilus assembly protein TadD